MEQKLFTVAESAVYLHLHPKTIRVMAKPSVENAVAAGLSQETMNSLDVPNPKYIESVSVEERTAIKIFVRQRTEF